MCGIIGYIGSKSIEKTLIDGLKILEYRGYDSCGISYWNEHEIIRRRKIEQIEWGMGYE